MTAAQLPDFDREIAQANASIAEIKRKMANVIAYISKRAELTFSQLKMNRVEISLYLIKSSSQSPAVMERWVLKVQALEEKKRHYEGVLQRELDGLDDEFSVLKLLSQELQVRARSIRSQRFQQRAA